MMYYNEGSWHLRPFLEPESQKSAIDRAVKCLERYAEEFDTIAVSGLSGVLLGAPLSYLLHKPLLVVRKLNDKTSHGAEILEGNYGTERFLIVDDLVASGETVHYIVTTIREKTETNAQLVGVYTHEEHRVTLGEEFLGKTPYGLTISSVAPLKLSEPARGL